MQSGVTITSVQAITITAPLPETTETSTTTPGGSGSGSSSQSSSGGLSSSAKLGIGLGAGLGGGLALLALLGLLLWRRRKSKVGDDFKWPELGDGTGSGNTNTGLYPNPVNPTGPGQRFDMDDDELFDGTTQNGTNGPMMSEREPSFLSSAAGSAGYNGAYGGMAGLGAGAAAGAGAAGAMGAASSQGHNRYPTQSEMGDYYSQDGHSHSQHGAYPAETSPYAQQQPYGYNPSQQSHQFFPPQGSQMNGNLPPGAASNTSAHLGRTGSIASTTAGGYQVGSNPSGYNRNRLSVVNNLGDVPREE